MAACERCSAEFGIAGRGRIPRFCSGRCRVAAHRAARLPDELTARHRWIRHSAKKVPLTISGRPASSTNATTWSTYAEAVATDAGVGLGFVLNGDGIVCLDLDHCLDGDTPHPWAQRLLDELPPTYIEISPSGDGLHVWGIGVVEKGRHVRFDGGIVEVYGTGRYMTVTGQRFGKRSSKLADLGPVLDSLICGCHFSPLDEGPVHVCGPGCSGTPRRARSDP